MFEFVSTFAGPTADKSDFEFRISSFPRAAKGGLDMAHSTLHFAVGMVVGSACTVPPLLSAWARQHPLHPPFARWFLSSCAVGLYAALPGLLRHLGVPDAVCDSPWMNVFLLYHEINVVKPGAVTSGPLIMGAILGGQYALLIAALLWRRQHPLR